VTLSITAPASAAVGDAISHYYDDVGRALDAVRRSRGAKEEDEFSPGWELPPLTDELRRFFSASELDCFDLGDYRGKSLTLLDLMGNPRTRTTKTFASLLIVARAVRFIQDTGRRVMILTPSSGNKATALRDAVLRALECGLAGRDQLQIVTVVPGVSGGKLWCSPLCTDDGLRTRNPVVASVSPEGAVVKQLVRAFVDEYAPVFADREGIDLWYTLDIDNYKVADAMRAFFEEEFFPPEPGRPRLHVHAVSSAYGLLGHNLGYTLTTTEDDPSQGPRYFLVQHLGTPDMVLSLYFGTHSRDYLPRYELDLETGLYRQDVNPRFPETTFDPEETLDATFYTKQPPTSPEMNELIRSRGGGGIVVSLHECLERYAEIRNLLGEAVPNLPADPRCLCEWSLVMAMTGILNAVDRGLVEEDDLVVHGSGCYAQADFEPVPQQHLRTVEDLAGLERVVRAAAGRAEPGRLPFAETPWQ